MKYARPLPDHLVARYHGWKATIFQAQQQMLSELAVKGQSPQTMIIACCDSRLHVSTIFATDPGELFVHRNIANLVPAYQPDGSYHGTSAAIEYGVCHLKVAHLIVLGHSGCGGVEGCYHMCNGKAPDLERSDSFVGRWLDIIRPGFSTLPDGADAIRQRAFEKAAILISLENLMSFPFVRAAVETGLLSLHGLWKDIGEGHLEAYDATQHQFVAM